MNLTEFNLTEAKDNPGFYYHLNPSVNNCYKSIHSGVCTNQFKIKADTEEQALVELQCILKYYKSVEDTLIKEP